MVSAQVPFFQTNNKNTISNPSQTSSINSGEITNGLFMDLNAANSSSYPGTGGIWTDLSGNGNNGALISGITFSSNNGGTMVFAGTSNNRVQTSFAPTYTDFTVCVWFKDSGSPQYGRLIDKDFVTGFWLGREGSNPNSWGGGVMEANGPYGIYLPLTDGQWHFMTSIRSGTTHSLYGDGITNKVSNTVSAAALSATSIAIGAWSGGNPSGPWNNQVFNGSIPRVLIYNRALSENEVLKIFNATKANYGL